MPLHLNRRGVGRSEPCLDNTEQQWVEDAAEAEEERADRENGRRTQVSHPVKTTDRAEQGAETGSAGVNTNFEEKP